MSNEITVLIRGGGRGRMGGKRRMGRRRKRRKRRKRSLLKIVFSRPRIRNELGTRKISCSQ